MEPPKPQPLPWGLLTLALCALLIPGIFLRDFWTYQEGRRALSSLEMVTRGDWLVPRLLGAPFLTKPPLLYWLQGAAFTLAGPTDWAARLPSALAAVAGVLVFARFLEGLLGGAAALCGAFALALCPVYFWMAQTSEPEMVFAVPCILAMMCFGRLIALDRPAWRWEAGFYAALAVAVLAKGLLCPAMVLLSVQAWQWLRRRPLLRVAPPAGLLLILLPLLAWMGAVVLAGFSLTQLYQEATSHAVQETVHTRPFFFYFEGLPQIMFPWGIAALGALSFVLALATQRKGRARLRAWFGQDHGERLLLALWFVVSILVLSAVRSKKPYYAVGLAAPTAGVCALLYHEWLARPGERLAAFLRRRRAGTVATLGALGAGLAITALAVKIPKEWNAFTGDEWLDGKMLAGWAGAWCLGMAGWAAGRRGREAAAGRAAMVWTIASLFVLASVYNFMIHPAIDAGRSMERMARELRERLPPGVPVATLRDTYSICFYWRRTDLPPIAHPGELKPFLLQHPGAVALVSGGCRDELRKLGGFEFLYVPDFFPEKEARVYLVGMAREAPTKSPPAKPGHL